jgi:hypothetical protein
MHDERQSDDRQDLDDPIAYRDLTDRLPNEALREELASITPKEREAYLQRLEELARTYLGPGGP